MWTYEQKQGLKGYIRDAILICFAFSGILAACSIFGGCDFQGLRFAPKEPLRQQGSVAEQLSGPGVPPFDPYSEEAVQRGNSVGVVGTYVGNPSEKPNMMPVLKARWEQYMAQQKNKVRHEIRNELKDAGVMAVTSAASKQAEGLAASPGKSLTKADAIKILGQVTEAGSQFFEAAKLIKIEDETIAEDDVAKATKALEEAAATLNAAQAEAVKKPTPSDVGKAVEKTVNGAIDTVTENPLLSGLITLAGGGGILAFLKKNKTKKTEAAQAKDDELAQAKHDAESAKREAAAQRELAIDAKAATNAALKMAEQATKELAKSTPAPASSEASQT